MKKLIATTGFICIAAATIAQLQVSTKTLDLETVNKHKGWNIIEAGIDPSNKQPFVKFAQSKCETSKSVGASTVTTTFKGLSWKIDKLQFDNGFNYISSAEKVYPSSADAILNNEYIYGRKFKAIAGGINGTIIGIGKLMDARVMPSGLIDNSYLGTTIVSGTASISGFKIGSSFIGVESGGQVTKYGPDVCMENVAVYKIDNQDAKEQKGQRWIPMFSHTIPNGGHILFNTSGVNTEGKQHFIFRKYDKNLTVLKEKAFTFDYQCLMFAKEVELAPGVFDYVFVSLPINYKKSELKVNPASQYEYFRIDGTTFEVKHQATITAPKSKWAIKHVYEKNNELYLVGWAGKSSEEHQDFSIPKESDFPNFQVAKIVDGKLSYVQAYSETDIKSAMVTVNGEKAKAENHLKAIDVNMDVANGKFIYSGQQAENGARADYMINAVFAADGKLETVITKEAEFYMSDLVFSKDGKTMYWLLKDVLEHNKWDKNTGTITPKDAKVVLTDLSVVTFNLDNKNIQYQSFKNDEWAVNFKNHILYNTENEVVLVGGKITRKAKESELVFVT
ncbi:MAG: hypothetical protein ACOVNY_13645, partial [Chitinophagaceae bacterium]